MTFVVNGKFTAQRTTGVQRVASELTRALNELAAGSGMTALLVPRNARPAQSPQERRRVCGWLTGNLWEQGVLPLACRSQMLVNLCNTAPLLRRRQMVMMHDMAIYDTPHAFTRRFRSWYRVMFAQLARRATHLLTVSAFSRERIGHHLGVPAGGVSVIRPAVDHMARIGSDDGILPRLGIHAQGYCLMVGSLDPRKNLARVLAAIDEVVCPPGLRFVIAGGANARVFSARARGPVGAADAAHDRDGAHAPDKRVIWSGFVSDGELKSLYENALCFVFPSLYEGFGLPPLEAMYCGCPVIVSREAALPETCGDAALYCDAHSIDDIANKIELMLYDSALRERYRQRGLLHARAHTWRAAAAQLCEAVANAGSAAAQAPVAPAAPAAPGGKQRQAVRPCGTAVTD